MEGRMRSEHANCYVISWRGDQRRERERERGRGREERREEGREEGRLEVRQRQREREREPHLEVLIVAQRRPRHQPLLPLPVVLAPW
jgi:hypothetical protein